MNDYSLNGPADVVDLAVAGMRSNTPNPDVEQRLQAHMRQIWQAMSDEPEVISWPAQFARSTRRHLVAACTVAAALLVAPLMLYMLFSSQSVYAQVLAGIRNSQTVYAKAIRMNDGQQVDVAKIWYDAQRGVREDLGKAGLRIDNGQFEWRYRSDTGTAIKGLSRDPIGAIAKLLDPVKAIDRYDGKRMQELDATLSGILCRAFVVSPPNRANWRIVAWLDDRHRLIRFEEQLRGDDDEWDLDERIDMRYDQPIPDERFTASFPPGTSLIDRTAPLEEFGLEDAIATAERLGIVLAVHEVRRVDEDTVFVMSTCRASQEVIDRFGTIDSRHQGSKVYGEFMWWTNGRRLPDHSWREGMRPLELAEWVKDGIVYEWVLLRKVKSRGWLGVDNRLRVGFNVYARNEWEELLRAAGKPIYLWNENDVLTLDVPTDAEGLDRVLSDVHAQTLSMGDATQQSSPWLELKSVPYTKADIERAIANGTPREEAESLLHGRRSQPEDITVEAWKEELLKVMEAQDNN